MTATDDSVLTNLGELFRMEEDRQAELVRAAARAQAEAAEAARLAVEREQAERVAAALATKRAEERERAERARAQDARLAVLRAELARVRAEREVLQLRVVTAAERGGAPSGRRSRWAGAMAGLSLMAATGAVAVSWPMPAAPVDSSQQVAIAAPAGASGDEVEVPASPGPSTAGPSTAGPSTAGPSTTIASAADPASTTDAREATTPVRPRRSGHRAAAARRADHPATTERRLREQLDFGGEGGGVLTDEFLRGAGR